MTRDLQQALESARSLSPAEQLELLQWLTRALSGACPLSVQSFLFWTSRSIDELAHEQRAPVVTDTSTLAGDFWPPEETADEFLAFIREQRSADRRGGP